MAPPTWSGDWTQYVGGTVKFDIFVQPDQNSTFSLNLPTVVLDLGDPGDGIYLGWTLTSNPTLGQWSSFSVGITSDNFKVVNSSLSFDDAIKNITGFFIQGDFLVGTNDISRLDNAKIAPVPEPGTLVLLGAGLIGLAGYSRKKL
jgi:hypothetical protein